MLILKQVEGSVPIADLFCEHEMSSASFYKWRLKYHGMIAQRSSSEFLGQLEALSGRGSGAIARSCPGFANDMEHHGHDPSADLSANRPVRPRCNSIRCR